MTGFFMCGRYTLTDTADQRRIRELERELSRKEKALAEAEVQGGVLEDACAELLRRFFRARRSSRRNAWP